MPDLSLQRLVVHGVDADVAAFRRAARANRTSRSEGAPLSFRRLMAVLPAGSFVDEDLRWRELFDLSVDPTRKLEPGTAQVAYNFQLHRGNLEGFLVEASRVFSRLCFILGTVDPCSDHQESCFAYDGRIQSWTLPPSQWEQLRSDVPEETEENQDAVFWAEVQADWAMMDAVVDHWADTAKKTRTRIAASTSTRHQTTDKTRGPVATR